MMTALAIGLLLGVTVWWLLIQRLKEKPWTVQGIVSGSQDGLTSSAPKVGLWVFLAMVTSLFLIFTSAYLMRMGHGHGGLEEWHAVAEPWLLWVNTGLLVAASVAMQAAHHFAGKNDLTGTRNAFSAGGALTIAFLAGQVLAWQQLRDAGHYDHTNPAYAFFVLLTAVHGLHLVGGLWVLGGAAVKLWQGLDKASVVRVGAIRQRVQLCTTYWHFLLLVWIGLFVLLLST